MPRRRSPALALLAAVAFLSLGFEDCAEEYGSPFFHFRAPLYGQLSEPGSFEYTLTLPPLVRVRDLSVTLASEGGAPAPLPVDRDRRRHRATGPFDVADAGRYLLEASGTVRILFFFEYDLRAASRFEIVELENSAECEVLNNQNCLLPYPSTALFEEDPTSETGLRLAVTASMLPEVNGDPLDPAPYLHLDGASPTVQIMMHFPAGVDVAGSDAPRLLPPGAPQSPPFVGVRMTDERSLESDSPTVLMRASTGERILHFVEMDARAAGNPAEQLMVMRPGESLIPGERYIVAVRGLVDANGDPVEAEAPFAALRDHRPTTIESLRARRRYFQRSIFKPLRRNGVPRSDLILAFDFVVQSEKTLTSEMLSMRDQAFTWLDERIALGEQTFTVSSEELFDCADPDNPTHKIVRGRFQVPLFLTEDPEIDTLAVGFLNHGPGRVPVQNGLTEPPFTISIPCVALDAGAPPPLQVLIGHGLFGTGEGMIAGAGRALTGDYIAGATNWRGLSGQRDANGGQDIVFIAANAIGIGQSQLNNIPALPDRLMQGQLNTLVLAAMMKLGAFNLDPAFQVDGEGVFSGDEDSLFYYGISLGGIMGTMNAALSPHITNYFLDVPAINFSFMLQRSTQFSAFELPLRAIGLDDPSDILLGLQLVHELWVRAEPAGYARHITGLVEDPLPGANPKNVLAAVAWLDKQVSNQATEVMARTLGIPNLDSSLQQGFANIPDVAGPQDSAMVIYDTGSFDIFDPRFDPFVPPLDNRIPSGVCDPHARRLTIPAALLQLEEFLQPGGRVVNFCNGVCDADGPFERPNGTEEVCEPPI